VNWLRRVGHAGEGVAFSRAAASGCMEKGG
jgi:hypothetical protein